jgi:hypothetical protein
MDARALEWAARLAVKRNHRFGSNRSVFSAWTLVVFMVLGSNGAYGDLPVEQEPISYLSTPARDCVARLQERLRNREVVLKHDERHGFLESVLELLEISPSSQTLVFSKTSFQHTRISPRTPRALYFSDDVYVGWVQGGEVLEVASVDPQLGTVFYLLDQSPTKSPVFQRETHTCLQCHSSSKTKDVPGVFVRSIYPNRVGTPVFSAGAFVTDQESPLKDRWGGWYVTGSHGNQRHMGNARLALSENPEHLDRDAGANLEQLKTLFDRSPYLTEHSDIVALMVLEHQTQMQNLITRANFEARIALYQEAGINKALGRPSGSVSSSTDHRINSYADKLVNYMLFCNEATLSSRIRGDTDFAEHFAALGPRDKRGRSLRELDLTRRLFRFPCSYMIGSDAFDALPKPVKDRVYVRLREILTGHDKSTDYAHLSANDRRAILEILLDTKSDLPNDWRSNGPAPNPAFAADDVAP